MKKILSLSLLFLISLEFFPTDLKAIEESSQELPQLHQRKILLEPITQYFNTAFDVAQNPYYFSQKNYFEKHKTLFKRIGSPLHSIKKDGGLGKLLKDEFTTTRVIPNIGLHAIGGAYDKLYFYQYFKNHNVPYPLLATAALSYLGHFGNESLELTNPNITSHDNIADLYFFDLISFFMAFNPSIMNFLVNDMNMMAWPFQPMFEVKREDIVNAGLNYIFRPNLFQSDFLPFLFVGMQNMFGLSYRIRENQYITFAAGMTLTDPLEEKGRFLTSLFYDKNNSLYASLFINGSEKYRVRLNLYPEVFQFKNLKLGIMAGEEKKNHYTLGVNLNLPLGLAKRI